MLSGGSRGLAPARRQSVPDPFKSAESVQILRHRCL